MGSDFAVHIGLPFHICLPDFHNLTFLRFVAAQNDRDSIDSWNANAHAKLISKEDYKPPTNHGTET